MQVLSAIKTSENNHCFRKKQARKKQIRNGLIFLRNKLPDDCLHIVFFRVRRVRRVRGKYLETFRTADIQRGGVGFWPQPDPAGPTGNDTNFAVNFHNAARLFEG